MVFEKLAEYKNSMDYQIISLAWLIIYNRNLEKNLSDYLKSIVRPIYLPYSFESIALFLETLKDFRNLFFHELIPHRP